MKTIVIRPEVITYHTAAFKEPGRPLSRGLIAGLILLPAVAVGSWFAGRSSAPAPALPPSTPAIAPGRRPRDHAGSRTSRSRPGDRRRRRAPPGARAWTCKSGLLRKWTRPVYGGDFQPQHRGPCDPDLLRAVFTSGRNSVIVTRTGQLTIGAATTGKLALQTAALRSTNPHRPEHLPALGAHRAQARSTPDPRPGSPGAEPRRRANGSPRARRESALSSVCKFTAAGSDLPSRFDTTAFRVETIDLLHALAALREIGIRDQDIALTVDPQLRIEAMIDPASRATAMRYYGITPANEWAYWKTQLLQGDPATRHYGLYGIARFYPDIALEMLPQWAREKRTTQVFRLTAIQALPETNRPEALTVLSDLVTELGRNTELGRAAFEAAQLLDNTLRKTAAIPRTVAFRGNASAF